MIAEFAVFLSSQKEVSMKAPLVCRWTPPNRFLAVGLLIFLLSCVTAYGQDPASSFTSVNSETVKSYGNLPLSFEPNGGQTGTQADYLARGAGYSLYLTGSKAVFAFSHRPAPASSNRPGNPRSRLRGAGYGWGICAHQAVPARPGRRSGD